MFKAQAQAFKFGDHYVIDMESLDINVDNPVIVQFACVKYSQVDGVMKEVSGMVVKICANSQLFINRTFSQQTLDFWKKQDPKVQKMVFNGVKVDFSTGVTTIKNWFDKEINPNKPSYLWSNGSLDDTVWLKRMYQDFNTYYVEPPYKYELPFKYNMYMCWRTMFSSIKEYVYKTYKNESLHDAYADAKWQGDILADFINRYDEIITQL